MARRNDGNTMQLNPTQQGFQGSGQGQQNWNPQSQQQPWGQQGNPGTASYQIPAQLTPTRKGSRLEIQMPQGSAPPRQLLIHGQFGTQRVTLSRGNQGGQYGSIPQNPQQTQPYQGQNQVQNQGFQGQGQGQNFGQQGNLSPQAALTQLAQTAEQLRQSSNQLARGIKQVAQQTQQMGGGSQTYNQGRGKRNQG